MVFSGIKSPMDNLLKRPFEPLYYFSSQELSDLVNLALEKRDSYKVGTNKWYRYQNLYCSVNNIYSRSLEPKK